MLLRGKRAMSWLLASVCSSGHSCQLVSASAAGLYEGTPVSIITTMMGMPNMDFVVREARAVVDGQMAVIRLGTCGALRPPAQLGSLMVASPGAVCIRWVLDSAA